MYELHYFQVCNDFLAGSICFAVLAEIRHLMKLWFLAIAAVMCFQENSLIRNMANGK